MTIKAANMPICPKSFEIKMRANTNVIKKWIPWIYKRSTLLQETPCIVFVFNDFDIMRFSYVYINDKPKMT